MAGHNRWSSIRHKKSIQDAKRGKLFTKLMREIMVAARLGGGDPEANPRLKNAIAAARAANMPKENIEKAIKKGLGIIEAEKYEEVTYEGYGPGGVAVFIEALTDNRNRTVAEIRRIFTKHGGSIGEAGCVSWIFHKKGYIVVDRSAVDEDKLIEIVIEAGAEDVKTNENDYEIITSVEDFESVKKALEENGIKPNYAKITMIPQTTIRLEGKDAERMLSLMESLEDLDDVQNVYANFDISDEVMMSYQQQR